MFDIAVIGAGPAGATFARLMAGQGLNILLLDGQEEHNSKPCGGLLAPDAQKALAHFDLFCPKAFWWIHRFFLSKPSMWPAEKSVIIPGIT